MSTKTTATVSVAVNIATEAQFYAYTVVTTGPHRFQVFLDSGDAAGGDYIFHLKKQFLGAGAAYPILDKTTVTAAASVTSFGTPTITIDATVTDVIQIWIDGPAGASAVTGRVEIWTDDYAKATDTIAGVTTVNGLAANVLTAAALATDAVTEIKDAVWTRSERNLTQSAGSSDSATTGQISRTRGDTWSITITGTIQPDWKYVDFTIKDSKDDPDTAARVWLRVTNPAAGTDGLQTLNGAAATAAHGLIAVAVGLDSIGIYLVGLATKDLPGTMMYYDAQQIYSANNTPLTIDSGVFFNQKDVTRRVS